MKQTFEFLDIDSAIEKLQKLKKENKKRRITICTIDFDNDEEIRRQCSPDEGCVLIRESKTIVFNDDQFLPHLELYSVLQRDLDNLVRKGVMHDIILPGEKV